MTRTLLRARYSHLSIALHWLMVLLLAAVYACIELRGQFLRGSGGRQLIVQLHFMLGLSVFVLVWLRLLARSLGTTPRIEPPPPFWQSSLARLMHGALYALVFFWGLVLPPLIDADKDLGGRLQQWHMDLGHWGYWLIGLHALAGLAHHYVRRDDTLRRMLPGKP
jgi:cytochrome b561